MAVLWNTGTAAQGDGLWVDKATVISTPSKHPEMSTNNRGRNWIPWFLHDVHGCWHRQKWSRLAGLQNTSTHFKMEPHQIILFNLCQWLVHVCIWSRWWSRDVRNLKISPGVKEEEHCRGGNLPEQPGQGCWLRKHSTDGLLPKPLLQWTALFIKCRVLTTKADKKANNILWKTIFCWFGKCSAEDNQQTGYFFRQLS